VNEEPDEEGEDEKDDVSAGALGLGLNRWSSMPVIAVVAGFADVLVKALLHAGRPTEFPVASRHRGQNAGRRDGVFFFPCLKTQRRSGDQRNLVAANGKMRMARCQSGTRLFTCMRLALLFY
jgi:hypothetical protein